MDFLSVLTYLGNIPNLMQGYLFFRILCRFAKIRTGKIWSVVVFCSGSVICNMIIYPNDLFNVTLTLAWFFALMLIAFHGSIWQKLAAVAVLYPVVISQNFLVLDMFTHWGSSLGWPAAVNAAYIILDPLCHLLIWFCIYRMFEKHLIQARKLFDANTWIMLCVICIASLVSITSSIYFSPEESYKMWPAALACFATNLGCIVLAEYFLTSIRQNMDRKNLMLQKSYYEELEHNQAEIRKFRHDMNNHLSIIRSLFQSGNRDEAERYMKEIESQTAARTRAFCKNGIINAVLNAKYNLAQEKGIDCFFHIDLEKLIGIDAVSLCCLFSNTLDNSIEACAKIPDPAQRYLSVKARVTDNGYFTYEIANAKQNAVTEHKGKLISDKEEAASHGFGLSNVREVVEKYNGTMDISYTEDQFTVTVLIGDS